MQKLALPRGCCRGVTSLSAVRVQGQNAWNCVLHRSPSIFPYQDKFTFKEKETDSASVLKMLDPFVSPERQASIAKVAAERTFSVVPVIEGIHNSGNIAAVLRSADAMGYGAVHCIHKSDQKYKKSQRSSAGADKWLDVCVWDDTRECLTQFKDRGFNIVATHMTKASIDMHDVDWTKPTAVVLGNEGEGISDTTVELSDACAIIPMVGFVESFNISVAAAVTLYEARRSRIEKLGWHGDLSAEEQQILRAVMFLRNKTEASDYVAELLNRNPSNLSVPVDL
ncbi:hypothetical protein BSKO_04203 [Bryopsis sp. KO-2023]|nr:hypothetical protein BSKO_04203 [Bryopsis sp. KO-2023]